MSASQSRFYDTDPSDPDAPVVLDHYDGPHGPVAMGDLVAYVNPEALWLDESDGQLLTVEEIVSFGADAPPLAILTTHDGEMWEVTANNLAPIQPVDGDTLTRHPDLRLRLILTIARTIAGRGDVPWVGHPGGDALAAHILTLDGDLRNDCALPTRWAGDRTSRDDITVPGVGVETILLPGDAP